MDTAGVVLCGGKSSRFLRQKIFETYHGRYFYERSIRAFKMGGIPFIYLQTNNSLAPYLSTKEAFLLVEEKQHLGPLYALGAAMRALPNYNRFFLLPADVPYIGPGFVTKMLQQAARILDTADALIPVSGEHIHPIHGIYSRNCLPVIEQLLDQQDFSMHALLQSIPACFIDFPAGTQDFININRQTDWAPPQA